MGTPVLYVAVSKGNVKIVEILLEKGADPNSKASWNNIKLRTRDLNVEIKMPALSKAVFEEKSDIAKLLLNHGADIHLKDYNSRIPLDYLFLLKYPDLDLVRQFLNKAGNINNYGNGTGSRETWLFDKVQEAGMYKKSRAARRSMDVMKILLEYGADPKLKNDFSRSAYFIADKKIKKEMEKHLKDVGLPFLDRKLTSKEVAARRHAARNRPVEERFEVKRRIEEEQPRIKKKKRRLAKDTKKY